MSQTLAPIKIWEDAYKDKVLTVVGPQDLLRKWLDRKFLNLHKLNGKNLLEIGCYPGRYLPLFGDKGCILNGVDLYPKTSLELPQWLENQGYSTGKFVTADFRTFDWQKKFDIVCSFGFIEHFKDWDSILKKHAELLVPGGYLIVTCPNFKGFIQKVLHYLFDRRNYFLHNINSMDIELWKSQLSNDAFTIIEAEYFGGFDLWFANHNILNRVIQKISRIFGKILKNNSEHYSPFCGIIAHKNENITRS